MMQRWGIRWNEEIGGMEFPVYDNVGGFVGYIWRMPEGETPKYRYAPGFPKATILYGLSQLSERNGLILTEGPLDAIWVQEAGCPGVAILGSILSKWQRDLITSHKTRPVTLCFDNDAAGRLAVEMASRMLRDVGMWVYNVILPAKYKDIQEVPLELLPGVLENKHLCSNGAGLIHGRYRRWLEDASAAEASSVWKH